MYRGVSSEDTSQWDTLEHHLGAQALAVDGALVSAAAVPSCSRQINKFLAFGDHVPRGSHECSISAAAFNPTFSSRIELDRDRQGRYAYR
jgi:hypothetical protein